MAAHTVRCPRRPPVRSFRPLFWRSIFSCPPRGCSPVYLSPKANYSAAVLCQSKLLYFTHTHTHRHRCGAHTPTHADKHLQQQLFLAAVEGRDNAFWPVCGEIYRHVHTERLFTARAHQEAKLVSAWKTMVYLPCGFILGWMWDDYKPVFIIWKMERPC